MSIDTALISAVLGFVVATFAKLVSLANRFGRLEQKVETHDDEIKRLRDLTEHYDER